MIGLADAVLVGRHVGAGVATLLGEVAMSTFAPARGLGARAERMSRSMARVCRAHQIEVRVDGDVPRSACVVVANHLSYLDPVVILPQAPALPIAKGEVERWPLLGRHGNACGVLFVSRDRPASRVRTLRRAVSALRAGVSVLNFPEGTTSDGARLLPFQRGIFGAARIARVPVVPVALRFDDPALCWTGDAAFLPHYLRTCARRRSVAFLSFGRPLWPDPDEPAASLAARAHAVIARELGLARRAPLRAVPAAA
jgi:1-acyl-sn-glycerol-3-phosphate acyltransferase